MSEDDTDPVREFYDGLVEITLLGFKVVAFIGLVALALVVVACRAFGQTPVPSPESAPVVRIRSHGGSGTVIHTRDGHSLILSCAHMFEGQSRSKPIVLDAPAPTTGPVRKVGIRLLAVDQQADLALIEMGAGPLPYEAPVSPGGKYSRNCLSVGYDEMRLPARVRPATILEVRGNTTYTRELPWHGRSGGALIDRETGYLVGVVSAYTSSRGPRRDGGALDLIPGEQGVYVSHSAVVEFLAKYRRRPELPAVPLARPKPKLDFGAPLCPT